MKKVRYAVVGAGWISQEAFMPSIAQTGNSEMTAIVTGNRQKAEKLAAFHGVPNVYSYEQYDDMLRAGVVDAVYIALPNSLHAEYAIRAAKARVHALVEKPLATTIADGEAMIAAAAANKVWLMTAYRLHTEPCTLAVLDLIRRGEIGDPRIFTSVFSFQSNAENHRLQASHWGGPLQDLGVYCVNAARNVFQAEPVEAIAFASRDPGDPRFAEVEESIAATLRFPGGRVATFVASFGAEGAEGYRVVGSKGDVEVNPGYTFQPALGYRLTTGGTVTEKRFPSYDHFSGQAAYFSDCILKGERPEPDGEEGLADMRAMLAIEKAAATGTVQTINAPPRLRHPALDMARTYPKSTKRLLV